MNKEEKKLIFKGVIYFIIIILVVFLLPLINLLIYGKFTWDIGRAIDYDNQEEFKKAQDICGEWGAVMIGSGMTARIECQEAPCKRTNINEMKNCVREGYTGTGFLGMKDYHTEYYVCEGYGRVASSCSEYWTKEDFDKYMQERGRIN